LAKAMHQYSFAAGRAVTSEGGGGQGFFVIREGKARVEVKGKRTRILGPGDYFGEMALISGGPRSATVTAVTDLRCQFLVQSEFREFVEAHPKVAWALLEAMVERIQHADN
jgi:CRP/FNR family transcriptional regulator, cyclic AMP receptor protein